MQRPELLTLAMNVLPDTGPVVIERLRQGLVNETYRVSRGDSVYALRVDSAPVSRLGVERGWESQVWLSASAAGIAPPVVYANPEQGIWVSRWVAGRTWSHDEVRSAEGLRRMADLLRRIHALAPAAPRRCMPPAAWIDYYRGARAQALKSRADACLAQLAGEPGVPVLCHSDLHPLNLVDDGTSLRLLDWEYAHLSDPFWDVAGWCANNDFDPPARRDFLDTYLGRGAVAAEWSRFGALLWLYDYVGWLWSELYLNSPDAAATAVVAKRAAVLLARLGA